MTKSEDFASLMAGSSDCDGRARRRLRVGQQVEGVVVQVGVESVFVDVGTAADARLDRTALDDAQGQVALRVGDRISARVIDARPDAPVLAVSLGRGNSLSTQELRLAQQSRTPVEGTVARAVKGGLEVTIGGQRAFCPASQIDTAWVESVDTYVGQTLTFQVLEVKDEGRSVVISRRALLEEQRREREQTLGAELSVGSDIEAVVSAIGRHGISLDLGGIEGFAHISELAPYHVQNIEDVARPGDKVRARVLSVEPTDRGLRVKLSLKQAAQAQPKPPVPNEILAATVVGANSGGLVVTTPRGEGFLPVRELELPPGGDHRRAHPTGTTLSVVTTGVATGGRLRLSARQVAEVVERSNYAEYTANTSESTGEPSQFGSLGDVFRRKLGLEDAKPTPDTSPVEARNPAQDAPKAKLAATPRQVAGTRSRKPEPQQWPEGIVRRGKRKD